jgi:Redoxin.
MFICRHCPYVKHVQRELTALANEYVAKGVGVLAISSNDATAYPEDAPESLKAMAQELGFQFPYATMKPKK